MGILTFFLGGNFRPCRFLFYQGILKKGDKMNYLANFITVLSLFCGFISIIFSLENHFTFACWAIILAVVFDGLDGQVARLNPVPSEFGKELDSLSDAVAFGVAPSILGYIFVYQGFHFWATVTLFVYLVCSIMRLAKYNITPTETMVNYFHGLPTTMSGGVLASFILMYRRHTSLPSPFLSLLLFLGLALLMVSRVKYPNLDAMKQFLGKRVWAVLVITAVVFFIRPETTVFVIFFSYLLFSPFIVKKLR